MGLIKTAGISAGVGGLMGAGAILTMYVPETAAGQLSQTGVGTIPSEPLSQTVSDAIINAGQNVGEAVHYILGDQFANNLTELLSLDAGSPSVTGVMQGLAVVLGGVSIVSLGMARLCDVKLPNFKKSKPQPQ